MKAWFIRSYGGSAVLEAGEVGEPELGPKDVLIAVHAASVNPIDWKTRNGALKPLIKYAFPLILGSDLSGEVISVGAGVTSFKPGDEVFTRPDIRRIGAFAERIAVAEDEIAFKPKSLDHIKAASVPLVALTAWQALLDLAAIEAGKRVLIHAGAGGVGTFAIQLAKYFGAYVATTASASKHAFVRELGANECIDYRNEDFATRLRDYDLVLDTLGGETLARSFAVLRPGGMVVSLSGPPDPEFARAWGMNALMRFAINLMSWPTRRRAVRHGVRYRYAFMHPSGSELSKIAELIDEGIIKPHIDRSFAFDAIDQAIAYAEAGHATGKVVVTMK